MSFAHPAGLWLLGLAIPILLLHFYRGRLRRLPVPSLLFWEQVLIEEERKSALRVLRHLASLLLNLLCVLILTGAVAEPRIAGLHSPPLSIALVVDTSPAMFAVERDGRTRLEHAREIAERWLARAEEASLYDGHGIVVAPTRDRDRLRAALHGLTLRAGGDVSAVAEDLRRSRPEVRVIYLSGVGSPIANRGWIGGSWILEPGVTLRLRALRAGGDPKEERILLRWNGEPLDEKTVYLRDEEIVEFRLDPKAHPARGLANGGIAQIAFADPDDFPLDDQATFVLPATSPLPVVVFHPGTPDPHLMAALAGLAAEGRIQKPPAVDIRRFAEARGALSEETAILFDRCAPPEEVSRGAQLFFGIGKGRLPCKVGREVARPALTDWDRTGPLLRTIDLTDLAVRRAHILEGGSPLIGTAEGPIAIWGSEGGRAVTVLGFSLDLKESDLAFRVAFPLFLRRWVDWIRFGRALRSFAPQARLGEPLRPRAPLWMEKGTLAVTGEGQDKRLRVEARSLRDTFIPARPGLYRIRGAGRDEWVGVNLFDRTASQGEGKKGIPIPLPPPSPWYRRVPLAIYGAVLAFLLLFLEWFLYHRGWI